MDPLGPVSLPPRSGPLELLVGVPDANRDRRTRGRLQVCLVPFGGSSWDVNTTFPRDFRGSRLSERVDFGGDFKSGNEFGPITAGHAERGRLGWVGFAIAASKYYQ